VSIIFDLQDMIHFHTYLPRLPDQTSENYTRSLFFHQSVTAQPGLSLPTAPSAALDLLSGIL